MKYAKYIIVTVVLLVALFGCGRKVIVEAGDDRPVTITRDGKLFYESQRISEDDLVLLVENRLEQDRQSSESSQYNIIMIQPDGETPYAEVRRISFVVINAGGRAGSPLSPLRKSSAQTQYADTWWNEYIKREDKPIPSDALFKQIQQQQLRLKSSGVILLDGKEIAEEELISLARQRAYLTLVDSDSQRAFDIITFSMVVDGDTPYRLVEHIQDILALNHCFVGITVAKDEKEEQAELDIGQGSSEAAPIVAPDEPSM